MFIIGLLINIKSGQGNGGGVRGGLTLVISLILTNQSPSCFPTSNPFFSRFLVVNATLAWNPVSDYQHFNLIRVCSHHLGVPRYVGGKLLLLIMLPDWRKEPANHFLPNVNYLDISQQWQHLHQVNEDGSNDRVGWHSIQSNHSCPR